MHADYEEKVRALRDKLVVMEDLLHAALESSRALEAGNGASNRDGDDPSARRGPDDEGFYADTYI